MPPKRVEPAGFAPNKLEPVFAPPKSVPFGAPLFPKSPPPQQPLLAQSSGFAPKRPPPVDPEFPNKLPAGLESPPKRLPAGLESPPKRLPAGLESPPKRLPAGLDAPPKRPPLDYAVVLSPNI